MLHQVKLVFTIGILAASTNFSSAAFYQDQMRIYASRYFFNRVAGLVFPYPIDREISAIKGSNSDAVKMGAIWGLISDAILNGRLYAPDNLFEIYVLQTEKMSKYWYRVGAWRGDGYSCYSLSMVERFGRERNIAKANLWAKRALDLWEACPSNLTSRDLLGLMNCYARGWGGVVRKEKAREIYRLYVKKCQKDGEKYLEWYELDFPFMP